MLFGEETEFKSHVKCGLVLRGDIFKWTTISRELRAIALGSGRCWSSMQIRCDMAIDLRSQRRDDGAQEMIHVLREVLRRAGRNPLNIQLTISDTYGKSGSSFDHDILSILGRSRNAWKSLTLIVFAEPSEASRTLELVQHHVSGVQELAVWVNGWEAGLEGFLSGLGPLNQVQYLNLWVGRSCCTGYAEIDDEFSGINWSRPSSVWPVEELCLAEDQYIYRPLVPLLPHWRSPLHHLTRLDVAASDGALISFLGCLSALRELRVVLVPAPDCEDTFGDTVENRLTKGGGSRPEFVLEHLHSLSLRLVEPRPGVANVLCSLGCPRLERFAVALPRWRGEIGHLSKFYTLAALGCFLDFSGANIDSFAIFPPPEYMLMAPHVASPMLMAALVVPSSRGAVRAWLKDKMPRCYRSCWGQMAEDRNAFCDVWNPESWPRAWQEFLVETFPWQISVSDAI
ncbi:hypothetical protein PM082_019371 [Marasmius tenuissimus]|nr:hypothetical protein PM082_019271 [Marasmius tenuissimus]KAJ8075044.1 hypothetical protein PM082_019371 [Marasmius tenuissimus]